MMLAAFSRQITRSGDELMRLFVLSCPTLCDRLYFFGLARLCIFKLGKQNMAHNFKIGLLTGLVLVASAGTALAATQVNCPQQQAKRMITDRLPSGWWTTPVVDRLSQTKVMNVGGKPTLMCIYGNAGSIQREAPRGKACRAVTGGFTCN